MSAPISGDEMPSRIQSGDESSRAVRVVTLRGDLDIETSPELRDRLNALIAGGAAAIVLDCAAVDYIDSTGLGTLVSALKQAANRDGALALARLNERVSRVLRVTGLDTLFSIYATLDDAREALAALEAG